MTITYEPVYDETPVRKVTVTGTFTFEAYVFTDENGEADLGRMEHEIEDAIEYRAVHAEDSEGDSDCLIALTGGGSGYAASVEVQVTYSDDPVTTREVTSAIGATAAWL